MNFGAKGVFLGKAIRRRGSGEKQDPSIESVFPNISECMSNRLDRFALTSPIQLTGKVGTRWYDETWTKKKDLQSFKFRILNWPRELEIPSKRFRLFVAANITDVSTQVVSDFALAALNRGMIYFWVQAARGFHDIVDEVIMEDNIGEQKFAGPDSSDTVMTTWHAKDTLEDAIDFFATCAVPTDGFALDSGFRLVICVANQRWASEADRFLQSAKFFV